MMKFFIKVVIYNLISLGMLALSLIVEPLSFLSNFRLVPLFLLMFEIKSNKKFAIILFYYSLEWIFSSVASKFLFYEDKSLVDIIINTPFYFTVPIMIVMTKIFYTKNFSKKSIAWIIPILFFIIEKTMYDINLPGLTNRILSQEFNSLVYIFNRETLTMLYLLFSMHIALYLRRIEKNTSLIVCGSIISILFLGDGLKNYLMDTKEVDTIRIGVLQYKLGGNNVIKNATVVSRVRVNTFIRETENLLKKEKDLKVMVWPENVILAKVNDETNVSMSTILAKVQDLVKNTSLEQIILGVMYSDQYGQNVSGALVVEEDSRKLIHKKYKVPIYEVDSLRKVNDRNVKYSEKIGKVMGYDALILICFESLLPSFYDKNPNILITLSNESSFYSRISNKYTMSLYQNRALEHNVYALKVGSPGYTGLIDNRGEIVKQTPFGENTTDIYEIPVINNEKIKLKDMWNYLVYILIIITAIILNRNNYKTED